MNEAPVVWDLSDLFSGIDDPRLSSIYPELETRAAAFEQRYRGRIASETCDAATLRAALDEYESISRAQARPVTYAGLLFSADTTDPARGALLQKMQVGCSSVATHLIFFPIEIGRMPEETYRRLAAEESLAPYRRFLEYERQTARHHLSEPEEKLAEQLGNTGARAFVRLFSEITARAVFRVEVAGELREMNMSQVQALLYDPDRELRRAAAAAITTTLKETAHPLTFIYNNLLQEKSVIDGLRKYDYPEQARHERNELDPRVVEIVVDVSTGGFGIVSDYYRLKRSLLGLDRLVHYDRYAPVGREDAQIPFDEARRMVLEAFGSFTPRLREMTEPFFAGRRIDAEVRPGKLGGAFCSYIEPAVDPYVFMNYTGRARDVMTLAHELGHAVHGLLAAGNHMLDFYPSLPMAETASVFAEMLVFEKLQERLSDPKERLALLCGKIEGTFATVFRQISMYRFEQAAHAARRAEGELTTERYNALWQEAMQPMFGDALALEEDHGWWWLHIPHIFASPFYVYAYSFGELMVLALYARYKQEGEAFAERYFRLLAAGGSRRPADLLQDMGIDPGRREFWQGGIDLIRGMVDQARELAAAAGG